MVGRLNHDIRGFLSKMWYLKKRDSFLPEACWYRLIWNYEDLQHEKGGRSCGDLIHVYICECARIRFPCAMASAVWPRWYGLGKDILRLREMCMCFSHATVRPWRRSNRMATFFWCTPKGSHKDVSTRSWETVIAVSAGFSGTTFTCWWEGSHL